MGIKVIDRRQALPIAIALVLVEAIALYVFLNTPFDIGYPPGTSLWRITVGLASVYVHYPVGLALSLGFMDDWPRSVLMLASFVVGLADLFLLSLLLVLAYRLVIRLFPR